MTACWEPIFSALGKPASMSFYRSFNQGGDGVNGMPNTWVNQGGFWPPPPDATAFFPCSKPALVAAASGALDTPLIAYCRAAQSVADGLPPGSVAFSFWQEAENNQGTPSSADVLAMHAHCFPIVKRYAPSVLYGQDITAWRTAAAQTKMLNQWAACPANGVPLLDFYGFHGYSHNADTTVTQPTDHFTPAFTAMRALAPNCQLAITETNTGLQSQRPSWFTAAFALAQQWNCNMFMPFFAGVGSGDILAWDPADTATISVLTRIAAQCSAP